MMRALIPSLALLSLVHVSSTASAQSCPPGTYYCPSAGQCVGYFWNCYSAEMQKPIKTPVVCPSGQAFCPAKSECVAAGAGCPTNIANSSGRPYTVTMPTLSCPAGQGICSNLQCKSSGTSCQ